MTRNQFDLILSDLRETFDHDGHTLRFFMQSGRTVQGEWANTDPSGLCQDGLVVMTDTGRVYVTIAAVEAIEPVVVR